MLILLRELLHMFAQTSLCDRKKCLTTAWPVCVTWCALTWCAAVSWFWKISLCIPLIEKRQASYISDTQTDIAWWLFSIEKLGPGDCAWMIFCVPYRLQEAIVHCKVPGWWDTKMGFQYLSIAWFAGKKGRKHAKRGRAKSSIGKGSFAGSLASLRSDNWWSVQYIGNAHSCIYIFVEQFFLRVFSNGCRVNTFLKSVSPVWCRIARRIKTSMFCVSWLQMISGAPMPVGYW